ARTFMPGGGFAAAISVWHGLYVTARNTRSTPFSTIARALEGTPAPVSALDAPELVFSFYLERPIQAISTPAELPGSDEPLYVIARHAPADSFDSLAEGRVNGRPFVLWMKPSKGK